MKDDEALRNPMIIPGEAEAKPVQASGVGPLSVCPKCGSAEFRGRNVQGCVIYTCADGKCREQWGGSLASQPQDPTVPLPPERYVPPIRFERNSKGNPVEVHRRVDVRPEFKKGAPISEGEE